MTESLTKAEKRRSIRNFFHISVKSNAEKVEKYLYRCSNDSILSSSTLLRDFFSPQREGDEIKYLVSHESSAEQQNEEPSSIADDHESIVDSRIDVGKIVWVPSPHPSQVSLPLNQFKEEEEEEEEEDEVDHKLSEAIVTNDPVTVTKQPDLTATITKAKPESMKRPGIIRSETEAPTIPLSKVNPSIMTKPEKRSSWLGGLFNDKKGERKQLSTKKPNNNTVITTNTNSPLSGFASLFTRSLSMKSSQLSTVSKSNSKNSAKSKPNKVNTNQAQSLPITTTITTITTNDNTTTTTSTDTKKKRSSRLEIPPPSERTFFNSNRLPLHVERAIYRLSHMKLADPRRPLRQQVLISNLMFWYLSIQQNDFQQVNTEQRVEADSPPVPDTQQKKGNKMSRLIHSAKKRRNEVAQFVQAYPLTQHETTIATTITSSRPSLKQSNVQFSLPPIPNHHPMIKDDIEDNVPLSHYRS